MPTSPRSNCSAGCAPPGGNATPAEQRVVAAWSGWGAVPEAFDRRDDRFTAERDRLRELLSREEYQRAEASILNAQRTQ